VPDALRPVLAKALHKDREKRYQTAAEFEQALAALDSRLKQGPAVEAVDENKKAADDEARVFADRIATLRSESRYHEAINSLRAMTLTVDPNLRGLAKWAEKELAVVQQEYATAQKKRDDAMRQAGEWMKMGKYPEAINLLEEIPFAFHNPELVDMLERAKNVLGQAQSSMQAIAQLRQEIKDQIHCKSYEGLRSKAERLHQLVPNDPSVGKLLQQLDKHEAQQQELAWKAVQQAPSTEGYRDFLKSYPNNPHVAEARAAIVVTLREMVLKRPDERALRGEYLAARDGNLLKQDEQAAREASMFASVAAGAAAGAVLGLAIGALAGPIGGLIAGALGGIAVGAILKS
jgi:tetratricopeptide (TPR) repeat protein